MQLVTFNISSNILTGGIPHELGNCLKLQRLDLSKKWFTGTLPDSLGKLINLELLSLSDNRLTGSIPSTIGVYHGLLNCRWEVTFFLVLCMSNWVNFLLFRLPSTSVIILFLEKFRIPDIYSTTISGDEVGEATRWPILKVPSANYFPVTIRRIEHLS
ncbi:hypothetical protein POM88_036547 [Heracleum sosnowskyi]|uniref:Uncharacterized protein n=1 Tax=Heracleum sosnowskyi TaxID=360622 RepID=A0AAD8MCG4_9APIA|nr:hypothetical protein POM88_036547 [Heracleum sosnowskyi]